MHHMIAIVITAISLLISGCSDSDSEALDKMFAVFVGNHSKGEIQLNLDQALRLYGVQISEDNYNRYGSVLVRLRRDIGGATEMEILEHVIKSHIPGVSVELHQMMAISVVALGAGDQ